MGSLAPIWVYLPGLCRKSTISTSDSFASSSPATSVKVTPVSFCMCILAVLLPTPMIPPPPMRFIIKFIKKIRKPNIKAKLIRFSSHTLLLEFS